MSGKQMSVRERFSLEFVTAKGSIAYSGAAAKPAEPLEALPDVVLFEEGAEAAAAINASASDSEAIEAIEELKALFGAAQKAS